MSEKIMVRRSVAVALGVICIVLVAGLVGAFAYYVTVVNSEIVDRDRTISSLNSQVTNLQDDFANFRSLNVMVVLKNQTVITQDEEFGWDFTFQYSGYILVNVTSTSYFTTVRVGWLNYGFQYLDQRTIRYGGGNQLFPIVASPQNWMGAGVWINFGTPANTTNTATVTVTYYY
jgi:predicted PurR-regulated permease PerM